MKNKFLFVIILLFALIASCRKKDDYITPDEKADILCTEILECFLTEDAEALEDLFSEDIQNSYELTTEIQEAFTFINGAIISYDEPFGSVQGKTFQGAEGIVELYLGGCILNIETDTSFEYRILFSACEINNENASKIGVTGITIFDEAMIRQGVHEGKGLKCVIGEE